MPSKALDDLRVRKDDFRDQISGDFKNYFGVEIGPFWDTVAGCIDTVALNNTLLHTPDGVSILEQMELIFGREAVNWCQNIQKATFAIKPNWELNR